MRIGLIVLLLVLIPLRTWANDSMAVQMATQGLASDPATQAQAADTVMPSAHCAEMAPADPTPSTQDSQPCGHCALCQVCATLALVPPMHLAAVNPQAHVLPWAPAVQFASAALAIGHKPPIF